jgi:DNA-directed RNA polymerase beta subunit
MYQVPAGVNVMVAVATFRGMNQEDALLLSRQAVQLGMLCSLTLRSAAIRAQQTGGFGADNAHEQFARKKPGTVRGRKMADYSGIGPDGIIRPGTKAYPDTVLVEKGFYAAEDKSVYVDSSVLMRVGESGVIDSVFQPTLGNQQGRMVRIRHRKVAEPEEGDKVQTRHGQKGVCNGLPGQEDFPFDPVTGESPHILVNPHGFPSRMTIGQFAEAMAAYMAAKRGRICDGSPFTDAWRRAVGVVADRVQQEALERAEVEELEHQLRWNSEPQVSGPAPTKPNTHRHGDSPLREWEGEAKAPATHQLEDEQDNDADWESFGLASSDPVSASKRAEAPSSSTPMSDRQRYVTDEMLTEINEILHAMGLQRELKRRLVMGYSGILCNENTIMGPVYVFQGKHRVDQKYRARGYGRTVRGVDQPTAGRALDGGVRGGHMELETKISHGAPGLIHDKTCISSDAGWMNVCRNCHTEVLDSREMEHSFCLRCEKWNESLQVMVPKALQLARNVLAMCLLHMDIKAEPIPAEFLTGNASG